MTELTRLGSTCPTGSPLAFPIATEIHWKSSELSSMTFTTIVRGTARNIPTGPHT